MPKKASPDTDIYMVDLPRGSLYGFPKPCPTEVWTSSRVKFNEWAVREGYPLSQIDFASGYVRCWIEKKLPTKQRSKVVEEDDHEKSQA
jgi:hypothetical protein